MELQQHQEREVAEGWSAIARRRQLSRGRTHSKTSTGTFAVTRGLRAAVWAMLDSVRALVSGGRTRASVS